jgi:hypothetical protein
MTLTAFPVLKISKYGTAELPLASLELPKLLLFSQIAYDFSKKKKNEPRSMATVRVQN